MEDHVRHPSSHFLFEEKFSGNVVYVVLFLTGDAIKLWSVCLKQSSLQGMNENVLSIQVT